MKKYTMFIEVKVSLQPGRVYLSNIGLPLTQSFNKWLILQV